MQLTFSKDSRTNEVAKRANELARHLKKTYPEIDTNIVELAARFRKSRFDDSLNKRSSLSEEEYEKAINCVRESGDYAARLLISTMGEEGARKVKQIIDDHLEHYDGTGPMGKKGDQVLPEAYVLNLSVAIQNMVEGIPNRNSIRTTDVLENVIELTGSQYPPRMISGSFRPLEQMLYGHAENRTAHLTEMGLVMASIFHDLSNYLTELSLQIAMLSIVAKDPDAVKRRCMECQELFNRMSLYITHMLAFARGDACKMAGDIHNSIENALTLLSSKLNQVDIEKEYGCIPQLSFYQTGLTHVFANLVKNGAEATKLCGKIRIRTFVEENHVVISISDNGEGMNENKLTDIFSGQSSKEDGHGIGTQFCAYVVRKHGGTIFYESREGQGTTVTVHVPLADNNE